MANLTITLLRSSRTCPGAQAERNYEVPDHGLSISAALQLLSRTVDSSIGYYLSCRRGVCACCAVRANGANCMACMTEVADGMRIEPVQTRLLIKDTVVDLSMGRDHQFRFPGEAE